MTSVSVHAARAVIEGGIVGPTTVEVVDGWIAAVAPANGDVPDRTLVPGFVDLQVNGHDDVDVAHADGDDWDRLDGLLAAQGVTSWCPTLVTAPLESYAASVDRIRARSERTAPGPQVLGVHLEGPFLGGRPGAHPVELLRPPDPEWVLDLGDVVALVTLAPESDQALATIESLTAAGITVALGHSDASYEQAIAAVDAGARLVTHAFNGMPGLHHREPGLLGAALTDDRVAVSLIADLVHVHPAALQLAARAKPPADLVLVTDAVAWRVGRVGEIELALVDGAPRLPDGTLAGSALTMDGAIRNLVSSGSTLDAAVAAASTNPARLLGRHDRGVIEVGRRADLVALTPDLRVETTWIGGSVVHGGESRR